MRRRLNDLIAGALIVAWNAACHVARVPRNAEQAGRWWGWR
jgi:hypothetical protein